MDSNSQGWSSVVRKSSPPIARPYEMGDETAAWTMTVVYAIAHVVVELACAFLVLGQTDSYVVTGMTMLTTTLLYNLIALAMRLPIGRLWERTGRDGHVLAVAGCATVIMGLLMAGVPSLGLVVTGVGSAMFHAGAGLRVLEMSGTKRADLFALFASTGMLGVFLGFVATSLAVAEWLPVMPALMAGVVLLSLSGVTIMLAEGVLVVSGGETAERRQPKSAKVKGRRTGGSHIAMVCLLGAVAIQAHMGMTTSFPWNQSLETLLPVTLATMAGIGLGGLIGDTLGWRRTAVVASVVSIVGFAASIVPVMGLLALVAFGMVLPIAVLTIADMLETARGTALGLASCAMLCGSLPGIVAPSIRTDGIALAVFAGVTLLLVVIGLPRGKAVATPADTESPAPPSPPSDSGNLLTPGATDWLSDMGVHDESEDSWLPPC